MTASLSAFSLRVLNGARSSCLNHYLSWHTVRKTLVLWCGLAIALAGCANMNTVERRTELPRNGKAIHLDAPQRIAVVNDKGWVCAEPSPDALQAYASSLGLGVASPSKDSVSIAQALSASAGSIGLRTQSITLMRDALYRICELYYNGGIDKNAALQLIERSQDLTLGILAIEQLTGAIVAHQVNLNTNSTAAAAASINDVQKELDKAKADESTKKTAADSAQAALDAQNKVVSGKTTEADAAKSKAKAIQAEIDQLTPALGDAQAVLEDAISGRLKKKLKAVALQAKIDNLSNREKTQQKQVDDLHKKSVAAENAYQEASKAEPKDSKKIEGLDKARQTAAAADANANKNLADTQKEITDTQTALNTTNDEIKAADKLVEQAQDSVDQVNAQLKAANEDPNKVAANKAAEELKAATDDKKKKQDALNEANKALEQAQANTKEIQKLGNGATATANVSGSGTGSFSASTDRYGVNKDTAEIIANATKEIVQSVLNKGHLTDSCTAIFFSYAAADNKQDMKEVMDKIMPVCTEVISATLAVYRSGGSAVASSPGKTGRAPASVRQPEAIQ